jgi:hypothetical protein
MEILQDIEKNILNINMYDKTADSTKLNLIKKQIKDYFKYKSDEMDIVMQKKTKYNDKYKNVRDLNDAAYESFLEKKGELYNIYRESKTLASLYDYLQFKYPEYKGVPDIYTYENISLVERVVAPSNKDAKCPPGKVLNPKTNKCVKEAKAAKAPKAPKAAKEPKAPKADKDDDKDVVAKAPKAAKADKDDDKDVVAKAPKVPKEAKAPKEPKAAKAAKEPKKPKAAIAAKAAAAVP